MSPAFSSPTKARNLDHVTASKHRAAPTPHPEVTRPPSRLATLDGLRGVAIALVVAYHYFGPYAEVTAGGQHTGFNGDWLLLARFLGLFHFGWSGVDLFFVLSGFLVGGILFDKGRHSNFLNAFWARRLWRLAPLYGLFLSIYGVLKWQLGADPRFDDIFTDSFPAWVYFTGFHNIAIATMGVWGTQTQAILWSLALEAQFYLLAPLLLRTVPFGACGRRVLVFAMLAPALRFFIWQVSPMPQSNPGLMAYVLFPTRMDALWLGVLVAWLVREPSWNARVVRYRGLLRSLAYGGALLWLATAWSTTTPYNYWMSVAGYSLLALWYALLVALIVTSTAPNRVLNSKILQFLGLRAYGIYLFHVLIAWMSHAIIPATPLSPKHLAVSLASLGICLLFAQFLWVSIESLCIRQGHRVSYEQADSI